jgi:hypothetical protein
MPAFDILSDHSAMDEASQRAAQEQIMKMFAVMGGGSAASSRAAFAKKSALAPPMTTSTSGPKVDQLATQRLLQAAAAAEITLMGLALTVGESSRVRCREASRRTAAELKTALQDVEMAAMYGGHGKGFEWTVEPGAAEFIVLAQNKV